MKSWWDLGEWSGNRGNEFDVSNLTCAFCGERGNFGLEHHAVKRKANGRKTLNFDTYRCGNCAGYALVLWSAAQFAGGLGGLHDFRALPWPLRLNDAPEHWPEPLGRYWLQAHRTATDENWDAASVMIRSALQYALRDHKAQGASLKQEIDSLAGRGVLPPHMQAWAHELRELGNDAAHPAGDTQGSTAQDVSDALQFLDFLLQYLYNLPFEIDEYRKRRTAV